MGGHNLQQIPKTKFLRKSTSWESVHTSGQMDGQTHIARLAVAFPTDARKVIRRFDKLEERNTFTTSFT